MIEIKTYVANKKEELKNKIKNLNKIPKIVIVQVNDDPASNSYIKGKIKDLTEVGFLYENIKLDLKTTEEDLLKLVEKLNNDNDVDGFIVQLPLPKQINEEKIKLAISPKKDVDGFNPLSKTIPATPFGIYNYLKDNDFAFKGKNALVIGRSNIVGKPMAKLLLDNDMNVTIVHSKTSLEDMKFYIKHADLIVVAVGKEGFLSNKFEFNKNCVIIDVGINRGVDGKLHGDATPNLDVKFQSPVPGGVGLLTRLALLLNLLEVTNNEF